MTDFADTSTTDLSSQWDSIGQSGTADRLIAEHSSPPDTRDLENVDQAELADGTYETKRSGTYHNGPQASPNKGIAAKPDPKRKTSKKGKKS